jgi:hypothetical protein
VGLVHQRLLGDPATGVQDEGGAGLAGDLGGEVDDAAVGGLDADVEKY